MSPKLCVEVGSVNTYFVLYTIVGKTGIGNLSQVAGFSLKYSFLLDKLNYNTLKVMIEFLPSDNQNYTAYPKVSCKFKPLSELLNPIYTN